MWPLLNYSWSGVTKNFHVMVEVREWESEMWEKKTSNWSLRSFVFWWTDTHLKKKEWFALDRQRDRQTDALPENPVYILLASRSSEVKPQWIWSFAFILIRSFLWLTKDYQQRSENSHCLFRMKHSSLYNLVFRNMREYLSSLDANKEIKWFDPQ